jgi:hypothetical protein
MRKRETAKAVAFAIVTFFILWLRRPDSLLNAQFWAEDGGVFFREQVLFGFSGAFVRLYSGYAHVIPRIVMALACALPVRWVPLGVNFSALAIAALACSAFFWPCYRRILSSDALRAVCCLLMAASIVVGSELIGIISNVQWYLCILSLLLIMTIQERMEMWLTVAQVAIALSAPVTLLFVPVLLWQAWKNPARYKGRPVVHLAALFLQAWLMYKDSVGPRPLLRFNSLFLATLSSGLSRCILSPLLGTGFLKQDQDVALFTKLLMALILTVSLAIFLTVKLFGLPQSKLLWSAAYVGAGSLAIILWGRDVVKVFLTFTGLRDYTAERYFLIGACMFIFFLALAIDTFVPLRYAKLSPFLLAGVFVWGTIHNFSAKPMADLNWKENAAKIESWQQARKHGEKSGPLSVAINPPNLVLVLD